MNLDESVTSYERRRYYLPEPQVRLISRAPYKVEHPRHTPTNLLRYYDTSRYTIQAQGLGQECLLRTSSSEERQSRSHRFARILLGCQGCAGSKHDRSQGSHRAFFLLPRVPDNPARSQRTRAHGTELPKTPRPSNRAKSLATRDYPDRPESQAAETSPSSEENPKTICFVASDCRLFQARQSIGPLAQDQYYQDGPAQEAYSSLLFASGASHGSSRVSICFFSIDSRNSEHWFERARLQCRPISAFFDSDPGVRRNFYH